MKFPDKIYLTKHMIRPGMLYESQDEDEEDVKYIKEEALLDWANDIRLRWYNQPGSDVTYGACTVLDALINQLNKF